MHTQPTLAQHFTKLNERYPVEAQQRWSHILTMVAFQQGFVIAGMGHFCFSALKLCYVRNT